MVLAVAVPIMIQNGITNFVNLLDNIMVGQIGTEQMSGVAIVNQLMFVFNICIFGGVSGAGIFTAQYHGCGDHKGVRDTFRIKLLICFAITAAGMIIFFFQGKQLISLYLHDAGETGSLEATLGYADKYLRVMMIELIPFAVIQAYSGTLRETGETMLPMKAGIAAVLVNLMLNYILIFGKFGAPALGVDDETDILDLLEKAFNREGYNKIIKIVNGLTAVETCYKLQPDLIILDVMLPDIDGYEVCKQIRVFSHCPILFLSSKNDELDKILGLSVGGDDYVTKPFSPREVVYRVKAQLRRTEYKQNPSKNNFIQIGEFIIDTEGCSVKKGSHLIELTAREFEILQYLAENKGRVISRERLYETVWGEDSFGCDNTIMVHIRHLREKLEDNPAVPQYLITMKGLGYKLVNPYEK